MDALDQWNAEELSASYWTEPQKPLTQRESVLLEMGLNPDEFAESKIDPAQFELAAWPNAFKDLDVPCHPCAMCGHLIRWAVGFRHLPSGELILVGEDCANYLDSDNVVEKQMKQFKTKVANEKEKAAKQAIFNRRREQMIIEFPDVVEYVQAKEQAGNFGGFMWDMVYAFNKWGSLTEKQALAVRKMAEREAEKAAALARVQPLLGGKRLCEGEIVSFKWQENNFGASVRKMVVKLIDGNAVYGSVPKSIADAEVGQKVSFFGNVILSDRDEHFGFFKNPSKAVVERATI